MSTPGHFVPLSSAFSTFTQDFDSKTTADSKAAGDSFALPFGVGINFMASGWAPLHASQFAPMDPPGGLSLPMPSNPDEWVPRPGTFGAVLAKFSEIKKKSYKISSTRPPFNEIISFEEFLNRDPKIRNYFETLFPELFQIWKPNRTMDPKLYNLDINSFSIPLGTGASKKTTLLDVLFTNLSMFYLWEAQQHAYQPSNPMPIPYTEVERCCSIIEDLIAATLAEGGNIALSGDPSLPVPFTHLSQFKRIVFSSGGSLSISYCASPFRNILRGLITEAHIRQKAKVNYQDCTLLDWVLLMKESSERDEVLCAIYQKIKPHSNDALLALKATLPDLIGIKAIDSIVTHYYHGSFLTDYIVHPENLSRIPEVLKTLELAEVVINEGKKLQEESVRASEAGKYRSAFNYGNHSQELHFVTAYAQRGKEKLQRELEEERQKVASLEQENQILRRVLEISKCQKSKP